MEENPYKAPAVFGKPAFKVSLLHLVWLAWFVLTIAVGLGMMALRVSAVCVLPWTFFMVVPCGMLGRRLRWTANDKE